MKIRLGDLKRIIRETVESVATAGSNDSKTAYKEFLALEKSLRGPSAAPLVVLFFKFFGGTPKDLQKIYRFSGGDYGKFFATVEKDPSNRNTAQQISSVFELLKLGMTAEQLSADAKKYDEGRKRFQEKYERDPMYASSTKVVVDQMTGMPVSSEEVDQGRLVT
jgi:hypothetical protein